MKYPFQPLADARASEPDSEPRALASGRADLAWLFRDEPLAIEARRGPPAARPSPRYGAYTSGRSAVWIKYWLMKKS